MKWKVTFGIVIFILLGSSFYWFQIRPSRIRSYCDWNVRWGPDKITEKASSSNLSLDSYFDLYDFFYKSCLRSKGIEK